MRVGKPEVDRSDYLCTFFRSIVRFLHSDEITPDRFVGIRTEDVPGIENVWVGVLTEQLDKSVGADTIIFTRSLRFRREVEVYYKSSLATPKRLEIVDRHYIYAL